MPQPVKNLRTITTDGFVSTGGAPEVTINLRLDGAAAAASIAVGAGTTLIISDFVVTSAGVAANFRLQQTNDGITFFDLLLLRVGVGGVVDTLALTELRSPVQVNGGATVAIRLRAETPAGAAVVSATIRSYAEAAV